MGKYNELMKSWSEMSTVKTQLSNTMASIELSQSDSMDKLVSLQASKGGLIVNEWLNTDKAVKENEEKALKELVSVTSDGIDDMTFATKEKMPEVETTSKELCSSAIAGATTALNISSEGISMEYVSVGYSIPQGIAQGITDGKELVITAIQGVLNEAMTSVNVDGLVKQINKELGVLMD